VGGKAGHENGLEDIEVQSPDGGNKSSVGIHVCAEDVAFLDEFVERLSHNIDFIVETLQFLGRLH
jgi:hypothetical protein